MTQTQQLIDNHNAPIIPMLRASNLVYVYGNLRKIVLTHTKTADKDTKEVHVDFVQPELIITQNSDERTFKTPLLKHPITAEAILKFVDLNRKYFIYKDGNIQYDETESNTTTFYFENGINTLKSKFDADIVEFNDEYYEKELLYSIVVNRTEKRVTIVFRGTHTIRDILQDLKYTAITPDLFKDFAPKVMIHRGFSNYLFKRSLKADRTQAKTKYEQITKVLEEVLSYKKDGIDYTGYDLFVTGHSLGGALAQILAFTLAGSKSGKSIVPPGKVVTVLSYASPECGRKAYLEAFSKLEDDNRLRHLRITNQGDAIPISVSSFAPFAGKQRQPGVNIHVYPDQKAKVGYNRMITFCFNPFNIAKLLQKHSPGDYKDNLLSEDRNIDILSKSVEGFYSDYVFLQ